MIIAARVYNDFRSGKYDSENEGYFPSLDAVAGIEGDNRADGVWMFVDNSVIRLTDQGAEILCPCPRTGRLKPWYSPLS